MRKSFSRKNEFPDMGITGIAILVFVLIVLAGLAIIGQAQFAFFACNNCILGQHLIISIVLWGMGILLWLLGKPFVNVIFFLFAAGATTSGILLETGHPWEQSFHYSFFAWISPLLLYVSFTTIRKNVSKFKQILWGGFLLFSVSLSIAFSLFYLIGDQPQGKFISIQNILHFLISFTFILSLILFLLNYRRQEAQAEQKNRSRILLFGTLFSALPLLLLSELPEIMGFAGVPREFTFPWLILSPLSYIYALVRHQLLRSRATIRRMAVYYLFSTLVLGVYLLSLALLQMLPIKISNWQLTNALLSLGLLLIFTPLKQSLWGLVNWVLYGTNIRYDVLSKQFAEKLSTVLDQDTLRHVLIDDLSDMLHIPKIILLLRNEQNILHQIGSKGCDTEGDGDYQISADGYLATHLQHASRLLSNAEVLPILATEALSSREQQIILRPSQLAFWIPLVSADMLHGLLLIGVRPPNDVFTIEEENILATLPYQAGIAAHNVCLMEQLMARQKELERAHQQLMLSHEQEQRRLAQELHDGAVQQLIGISYKLVGYRQQYQIENESGSTVIEDTRQQLLVVVRQLRELIGELRPAGLKEFGLTDALQGFISTLKRQSLEQLPEIKLDLDNSGTVLSEYVAISLFRVAQEALRNAIRYAHAQHIGLTFRLTSDEAILMIWDDGVGFQVPTRISELTYTNHFGLVGMTERVAWVGGKLSIRSQIGKGTEIIACIPINGVSLSYEKYPATLSR